MRAITDDMIHMLLERLSKRNITIWTEAGKIKYKAPAGALTSEELQCIKENKEKIIKYLENHAIWSKGVKETFPLTSIQKAYLIGSDQAYELGGINAHYYMELNCCDIDVVRFERAVNEVIARTDAMRTIVLSNGMQAVLEKVPTYKIEEGLILERLVEEYSDTEVFQNFENISVDTDLICLDADHTNYSILIQLAKKGVNVLCQGLWNVENYLDVIREFKRNNKFVIEDESFLNFEKVSIFVDIAKKLLAFDPAAEIEIKTNCFNIYAAVRILAVYFRKFSLSFCFWLIPFFPLYSIHKNILYTWEFFLHIHCHFHITKA